MERGGQAPGIYSTAIEVYPRRVEIGEKPSGLTSPSRRTGRKEDSADAEHKPSRAPSVKKGVSGVPTVGNTGGIYSKQDSELARGCAGGRGHRVDRPGQVGAASGGGYASGIPQRPWQDAALIDDGRHGRAEETASAGLGAALREQATAAVRAPDRSGQRAFTPALPSRARPRRFRAGVARTAWRWCAALGLVDRAAAGEVATGARSVAKPAAGQSRSSVRLGRWYLFVTGS